MNIFLWVIIILFFLFSLIGSFIPVVPDIIPLWIGIMIYQFFLPGPALSLPFWTALVLITILTIAADFLANAFFVQRSGGSTHSIIGAFAGIIIGLFLGPIGIIIGPFIGVLLVEYIINHNRDQAFKIAFSTIFAYLGSGVVKVILQLAVIFWFFWES